ncbi:hypothetical protein R1flu_027025 [Riccia fluitans]|uniref:Uncharacterized protein n=1 Tax=Riccia fluitans TaxID=41844 RepID=A0ABD1XHK9_9MARC
MEMLLKQRDGLKWQFPSTLEFVLDNYRAEAGRELNPNDRNSMIGIRNQLLPIFDQMEVTGILFAWIMNDLGDFPEILQKVKAEQDEIATSKNRPDYKLTPEDLENMKYSYQAEQDEIATSKNRPDYKLTPEDLENMKYSYQFLPDTLKKGHFDRQSSKNGFTIRKCTVLHAALRYFHYTVIRSISQTPTNSTHHGSRWTALDPAAPVNYNPIAHIRGGYPVQTFEN